MNMSDACLSCFLAQAERVLQLLDVDGAQQKKAMAEIEQLLPQLDMERSPPVNAMRIYAAIAQITGCADPYRQIKIAENSKALARLPELRSVLSKSNRPLLSAMTLAITGNLIDYGVCGSSSIARKMASPGERNYVVDHRHILQARIEMLSGGGNVLYLADNSGEIVYDMLLVEMLTERGLDVTVAVKSGPIINDALMEDAVTAGMNTVARVIEHGAACPGTPLGLCSQELRDRFMTADVVISKGQGNFETLSTETREIFFLLTVKCDVVGKHLADISGCKIPLPANGEMVTYRSGK